MCIRDSPAPDLSPSQSGIPSEEFASRLRKHLHHDDTDTELEVAIEDPPLSLIHIWTAGGR